MLQNALLYQDTTHTLAIREPSNTYFRTSCPSKTRPISSIQTKTSWPGELHSDSKKNLSTKISSIMCTLSLFFGKLAVYTNGYKLFNFFFKFEINPTNLNGVRRLTIMMQSGDLRRLELKYWPNIKKDPPEIYPTPGMKEVRHLPFVETIFCYCKLLSLHFRKSVLNLHLFNPCSP